MASRSELQNVLKEKYGINKNISESLSVEQCERLIFLLEREPSAINLVEAFVKKNASLGRDNAKYGGQRDRAERKLEALKQEFGSAPTPDREKQLDLEKKELEAKIRALTSQNQELLKVNDELKRDNKFLKNSVDAIRLGVLRDMKQILRNRDSELRQALMKWLARSIE